MEGACDAMSIRSENEIDEPSSNSGCRYLSSLLANIIEKIINQSLLPLATGIILGQTCLGTSVVEEQL